MEIIPDKRKIVGLVEQAQVGKVCLPNFQRDFVWSREEVADLLRSMMRGYFIGSLLLLRCDPENVPFAPVALRGANPSSPTLRPDILVLDGQQRLTSLLYALTAPDLALKGSGQRRRFFLNLDRLISDPDDDEIVFDLSDRELEGLDKPTIQYERKFLPCTALMRAGDFWAWRDGFEDWLRTHEPETLEQYRAEWRTPWSKVVTDFQSFEVALVELPRVDASDSDSIGRVCAIFEKLNSTGEELSVYDLLTARLYPVGVNLHELWESSCREHERLNKWSEGRADTNKFGVMILRTLALRRGLEPKPRVLIGLAAEQFTTHWQRAARAVDRALELLERVASGGFGVFDHKWLPGFGFLPVLAALRAEIEDRELGEGPRADLQRWYWCNVFLERFSSGVESKSRRDYVEMLDHWIAGGPEPSVFAEARARIGAPGYSIRDSASYGSAVYSGVFCLLALQQAQDWRLGEAIDLQKLEDHHIFPRAWLHRHAIAGKAAVNTVANRTLISDKTNKTILDSAPADYLANPEVFPPGASSGVLTPHFIDDNALGWMQEAVDDLSKEDAAACYEEFCAAREALIISRIRVACGVQAQTRDGSETEPPVQPGDLLLSGNQAVPRRAQAQEGTPLQRSAYVAAVEQRIGTALVKRTDVPRVEELYVTEDKSIAVVFLVSKRHSRTGGLPYYWFSLSSEQRAALEPAALGFAAFCCGPSGRVLLIPLVDVAGWLPTLSLASPDSRPRWHFHIDEVGARLSLRPRQPHPIVPLDGFLLGADTARPSLGTLLGG